MIFAAFYAVIDVAGYRRWTLPAGGHRHELDRDLHDGPIPPPVDLADVADSFRLGVDVTTPWSGLLRWICGSEGFNPAYLPIVESVSVLVVFWLVCWWLFRQKMFVRV